MIYHNQVCESRIPIVIAVVCLADFLVLEGLVQPP